MNETRTLHTRWSTLSPDQKQNIVETVTESIIIDKDIIAIHFHYLPFFKKNNIATHDHGFMAATN